MLVAVDAHRLGRLKVPKISVRLTAIGVHQGGIEAVFLSDYEGDIGNFRPLGPRCAWIHGVELLAIPHEVEAELDHGLQQEPMSIPWPIVDRLVAFEHVGSGHTVNVSQMGWTATASWVRYLTWWYAQ